MLKEKKSRPFLINNWHCNDLKRMKSAIFAATVYLQYAILYILCSVYVYRMLLVQILSTNKNYYNIPFSINKRILKNTSFSKSIIWLIFLYNWVSLYSNFTVKPVYLKYGTLTTFLKTITFYQEKNFIF